jgi:hypothetical protein
VTHCPSKAFLIAFLIAVENDWLNDKAADRRIASFEHPATQCVTVRESDFGAFNHPARRFVFTCSHPSQAANQPEVAKQQQDQTAAHPAIKVVRPVQPD